MRILWRVLVVLVLIAAVVGVGAYTYNLGIAQGVAQKLPAAAAGTAPVPYPYFYGHPFFWGGFGFLSCLIPLFLFFLIFGSLRALFWHGPMGYGRMHRHGWWRDEEGKGVPPYFAEMHRRMHETPDDKSAEK